LLNLAKNPASTIQILGAEKALFRALKTKHNTPKYGLIYHASLVGHSAPKNKGKIARLLASKCALSCRVDALGDGDSPNLGYELMEKVETRRRQLESTDKHVSAKGQQGAKKYDSHKTNSGDARKSVKYDSTKDSTAQQQKGKNHTRFQQETKMEEEAEVVEEEMNEAEGEYEQAPEENDEEQEEAEEEQQTSLKRKAPEVPPQKKQKEKKEKKEKKAKKQKKAKKGEEPV